jgi:hypothetical protein
MNSSVSEICCSTFHHVSTLAKYFIAPLSFLWRFAPVGVREHKRLADNESTGLSAGQSEAIKRTGQSKPSEKGMPWPELQDILCMMQLCMLFAGPNVLVIVFFCAALVLIGHEICSLLRWTWMHSTQVIVYRCL